MNWYVELTVLHNGVQHSDKLYCVTREEARIKRQWYIHFANVQSAVVRKVGYEPNDSRKVYAVFHGGSSYSPDVTADDVEAFDSIQQIKTVLWQRRHGYDNSFPAVDDNAAMFVFFTKPVVANAYDLDLSTADRVYVIGKRGGIVRESV